MRADDDSPDHQANEQPDEPTEEESDARADRLDELLSGRAAPSEDDSWLLPLLNTAADSLRPLAAQQPRADFADALEARLMAELEVREHQRQDAPIYAGSATAGTGAHAHHAPGHQREPEMDGIVPFTTKRAGSPATQGRATARRPRQRLHRWQKVALATAAALILIPSIVFAIAAFVPPDSVLYAVHRVEQNARLQLASSPSDRARLQIGYAQGALSTLEGSINQQSYANYSVNLAEFERQYHDAETAVAAATASPDYPQLESSLDTLRAQASNDLRHALASVNWKNRLRTTDALGKLHNTVPVIKQVTPTGRGNVPAGRGPASSGATGSGLPIQIHGGGFVSGAVVYINGQPSAQVIKVNPNEIQAVLPGVFALAPGTVVGVTNPDGTAAQWTVEHGASVPAGVPTPTPNTHGNGGKGGHG